MPVAASAASPDDPRDGQPVPLHGLVLVSTPIGNLGDISTRARAVLAACDLILCEDTRRTGRLLAAMDIHTRTETLHEHNEDARIESVLARLTGQRDDRFGFRRGDAFGFGSGISACAGGDSGRSAGDCGPWTERGGHRADLVWVAAVTLHVPGFSAVEAGGATGGVRRVAGGRTCRIVQHAGLA